MLVRLSEVVEVWEVFQLWVAFFGNKLFFLFVQPRGGRSRSTVLRSEVAFPVTLRRMDTGEYRFHP